MATGTWCLLGHFDETWGPSLLCGKAIPSLSVKELEQLVGRAFQVTDADAQEIVDCHPWYFLSFKVFDAQVCPQTMLTHEQQVKNTSPPSLVVVL